MIAWFTEHYIEILGTVLSILYLFLSIRQNLWLWPVGLISAILYVIVFFNSKFYADMGLNAYYVIISIYGWITWSRAKNSDVIQLPIVRVGIKQGGILLGLLLVIFIVLGVLLDNYTDSPLPYWDAFTTAGSIVATWMLAKKILEHWMIWIVVDLVSLVLYVKKGLYPTSVLFAIYSTMAVFGYFEWKRSVRYNRI